MQVLHRRCHALVPKLLLSVVWPDVIRPMSRHAVPDGVPRHVLVLRNRDVPLLDESAQEVVTRLRAVSRALLREPEFVSILVLLVSRTLIEPAAQDVDRPVLEGTVPVRLVLRGFLFWNVQLVGFQINPIH